jgi:hypothetical protein
LKFLQIFFVLNEPLRDGSFFMPVRRKGTAMLYDITKAYLIPKIDLDNIGVPEDDAGTLAPSISETTE